ncbi:MAG TPA: acyl-ACP--UDP-N-acetylglucosamine O-acyltransferase, partial [Candidatus Polarisedimenticolia bacterium]|nr:acyl-ACP--UDP-N-acetylglucosamine O-acyltransferase [Candidatus Polarisedimenticolia bacterium]
MSGAPAIHPSAEVDPGAVLGPGTTVGPQSVIGPEVTLGPGCLVGAHVVIGGPARFGGGNRFYPFACLGMDPQDLKYSGERTALEVGDNNTFREGVTVHRGTAGGGGVTRLGSQNLLMAQTHIAHDCQVGSHAIFANAATLAGHVTVEDGATIGAFSGVHQFCRVGEHAYIGGYSVITQDALPYVLTVGNRARSFGINVIGLERRKFSPEAIQALKQAYRILFRSRLTLARALGRIDREFTDQPEVGRLSAFIRTSQRGVIR